MTMMEKKMDILIRVVCAEDSEAKKEAMKELRELRQTECGDDIPKPVKAAPTEDQIRDCTEALLFEIGVPASLKGFYCLVEAITLCVGNKDLIHEITKGLYPEVSKRCNTTPSRAERAMRHAIEVVFERCETTSVYEFFGNTINIDKGKPTNSEFLSRMALEVKKRIR